jgi:DNA replication initiation complex subunit (GINS family)
MDKRILLLMLLGVSLLVFGCAGKKAQTQDTMEQTEEQANDTMPAEQVNETTEESNESTEPVQNDSDIEENETVENKDLSEIADLFVVDTDKPLEGEGLDVDTPESNKS